MKRFVLFLLFFPIFCFSQQIQWVAKVLKSSSDLGGKQYSSRRVIGKPDAFPQGGNSPNAWAPKNAQDGHDFIEVEFEKPQTVKQIAIFENLNAGCLVKVMVSNGDGKYKEVFRNKIDISYWKNKANEYNRAYYFSRKRRRIVDAPVVNENPGIEYANLEESIPNVKALRVVFNFKKSDGDKQIDAIGISDSETPIIPIINTKSEFENLQKPQLVYSFKNSFNIDALQGDKLYLSVDDEESHSKIYSLDLKNSTSQSLVMLPKAINSNSSYNYIASVVNSKFIIGGSPENKTGKTGYLIYNKVGNDFVLDKPLEIVAYSNFDETSNLAVNNDGSVLLAAVESDISQGGLDIYFSKIKEDGTYSYLQNLGKIINSANDEYAPFLSDDEKTLFFASNGKSGYGSEDLYYTVRLDDSWKNWSEPVNLGPIINDYTSQNSVLYDSKNEELYYSSYKEDSFQLFKIKIPKNILKSD